MVQVGPGVDTWAAVCTLLYVACCHAGPRCACDEALPMYQGATVLRSVSQGIGTSTIRARQAT